MTAATLSMARSSAHRPGFPRAVFVVLGLLLAVVAIVGVLSQPHAVMRHGDDAVSIRRCLDKSGPQQVWLSRDKSTWYLLCQLPDTRWGFQAVTWDKALGKFVEKTAFVRGNGSWSIVKAYLEGFATRWTGVWTGLLP